MKPVMGQPVPNREATERLIGPRPYALILVRHNSGLSRKTEYLYKCTRQAYAMIYHIYAYEVAKASKGQIGDAQKEMESYFNE